MTRFFPVVLLIFIGILSSSSYAQNVHDWVDVRDFFCSPESGTKGLNADVCSKDCAYCNAGDGYKAAWCQKATITVTADDAVATIYDVKGEYTDGVCWTASPTGWTAPNLDFTVNNSSCTITLTCNDPLGIPQWAQCDVQGSVLLVGPLLVIVLLVAMIIVLVIYCCPCWGRGESKADKAKADKKPEVPKDNHPIFDQWSKVDVAIETKDNDDTSIEMDDKPTVYATRKPVDAGYQAPERKAAPAPKPQAQYQQLEVQAEPEPDYFASQEKAKPFRPQTLTIDVNALDDFFEDDA